jgi:hypothetical protein
MKKTYLLFFFLSGFFLAQSQTLLDEGFESGTFPPVGWTLINGNTPAGNNWKSNTDASLVYVKTYQKPYPTFLGLGSIVYETDSMKANAWAITPALSLTNSVSYTISFYYRVANDSFPEKLKVTVGTDTTISSQSTVIWNNNGAAALANDSAWSEGRINYTATATGNIYFGFNCYSNSNALALVADKIKVEVMPAGVPPCATRLTPANGATNVSAPEALFSWNNPAGASDAIFEIGTTNPPAIIDSSKTTSRYYSNLAYNTTYYWSVVPANAAGRASGCPVYSFTTQAAPPVPLNDNTTGAIAITANGSVKGYTKSATQSQPADSCNGYVGNANDDVWYTFTPSQAGSANITLTPDLNFDAVMDAYSGTPGSFVSIACADQGAEAQQEVLTLTNLTAGEKYYFRVYGYGDAGKDGSFTLTASGITLPVEITSFKGEQNGYQNILSWTTLTEQNNKGFELQRSANGRDFSTLRFIASRAPGGNSSLALNYEFTDVKPFTGNAYYRLKQVDIDGRSKTSNIVLLKRFQVNAFALSNVYPNPANAVVNIILTAPSVNKVNIIITDIAGKPVMQQAAQLAAGSNNLSIYVNKLPAGSYMIKAICANGWETTVSKFVKQ